MSGISYQFLSLAHALFYGREAARSTGVNENALQLRGLAFTAMPANIAKSLHGDGDIFPLSLLKASPSHTIRAKRSYY